MRETRSDCAIGVEPIWAAIEREARLEARHFGGQRVDVMCCDVGRIGEHEIERAVEAHIPASMLECEALCEAERRGVRLSNSQRAVTEINADAARIWPFGKNGKQDGA